MHERWIRTARAATVALLVVLASGQLVEAARPVHGQGTGRMTYFFDLDEGKAGYEDIVGPDLFYDRCQTVRCDGSWPQLWAPYGMRRMSGDRPPTYAACRDTARVSSIPFASLPDGAWLCVKARHRISGARWGTRFARVRVIHSPRDSEAFTFSYLVWE
jgi:hypothetical protein